MEKSIAWAVLALMISATDPTQAAPAGSEVSTVLAADTSIALAEAEGDRPYLGTKLDDRFTFIDWAGTVRKKAQFLADLPTIKPSDTANEPDVRLYGALAVVTGNHYMPSLNADTRFLHVFVRRAGAWAAFAFVESVIQTSPPASQAKGAGPVAIPPGGGADACDNPCRTIPFSPRNAAERGVLDAYKQVETESVTGDVEAFAKHLADELEIVIPNYRGKPVTKSAAVASHQQMRDKNIYYPPVPITQAEVAVFGDAALMTSRHAAPSDPTQSSILVQLWVRRDGRWQLALSQQIHIR